MKFGLRIKKTVLAVALCFIVDIFRQGMVFFSVIAAILTLQKDKELSYHQAMQRIIGTFIGGFIGLISIILFQRFGIGYRSPLYILIISLMAVPVININLWLKKPSSAGFSCVVYYSMVIGHFEDVAPFVFVRDRMIDTLIGIAIALLLNLSSFINKGEVPQD